MSIALESIESQSADLPPENALTVSHNQNSMARPARSKIQNPEHLVFTIPEDDASQSLFHSLPNTAKAPVRDDIDRLLNCLEAIHTAEKINPEIRRLAQMYSGRAGFTFQSLRAKYYWYTHTGKPDEYGNISFPAGDWRMLVNWAKVPKRNRPGNCNASGIADRGHLCAPFLEYLKGLYGSNQRKSEPAIRKLYALWRAGDSIPGYGTWEEWFQAEHPHLPLPDHCPPDLPRGWHKSNLRKYIPDDAELALTRQGKSAALQLLPCILQTREGLRPLEYIEFDDFRTDFKVLVPGYASPVELNGLVAIDVATGRPLRYGLRAAIPREDGMKDKLKLHDMKVLIAGILLQYGLPRHYVMHLIVENATATVRDAFALALSELFKSASASTSASASNSQSGIEVQKTEIIQGTSLWAGYKNRPGGNPRGKPHVESTFNLFHNEAGFLQGQIGRRYDSGPSDLHGRTREAESLARVGRHLTPHQRAALKAPFLNYAEARIVCTDIWNRIYQRTDHQMEAFQIIGEFRFNESEQWIPDGDLAVNPAYANIDTSKLLWRNPARKESPAERWERLCWELVQSAAEPQRHSSSPAAAASPTPEGLRPLAQGCEERATLGNAANASNPGGVVPTGHARTNGPDTLFRKPHPSIIARLYDEHKIRPVTNYEIAFDHDKEHCVYRLANIQFASAAALAFLKQKTVQVLCYYDPQDLAIIHCTDGQGGYLGSIPRTRGIRKTDKDALKADYDRKQREYQALKDTVSARLPQQAEQRLEEIDHNCEVLKQALENADAVPAYEPQRGSAALAQGCDAQPPCVATLGNAANDPNPNGVVPNSGSAVADAIAAHATATAVQKRQAAAAAAKIAAAPRSLASILNGHAARTT